MRKKPWLRCFVIAMKRSTHRVQDLVRIYTHRTALYCSALLHPSPSSSFLLLRAEEPQLPKGKAMSLKPKTRGKSLMGSLFAEEGLDVKDLDVRGGGGGEGGAAGAVSAATSAAAAAGE